MKITIICVGKMQSEFIELYNFYKKRVQIYASLDIIEIKEQSNIDNVELKIKKETSDILSRVPNGSKVIYCSLKGKQFDSEEFANYINDANITFVIGGSNGVDETKFENKINFSKMTFPHQLFRVLLLEQIYRGHSILNNSKYNK